MLKKKKNDIFFRFKIMPQPGYLVATYVVPQDNVKTKTIVDAISDNSLYSDTIFDVKIVFSTDLENPIVVDNITFTENDEWLGSNIGFENGVPVVGTYNYQYKRAVTDFFPVDFGGYDYITTINANKEVVYSYFYGTRYLNVSASQPSELETLFTGFGYYTGKIKQKIINQRENEVNDSLFYTFPSWENSFEALYNSDFGKVYEERSGGYGQCALGPHNTFFFRHGSVTGDTGIVFSFGSPPEKNFQGATRIYFRFVTQDAYLALSGATQFKIGVNGTVYTYQGDGFIMENIEGMTGVRGYAEISPALEIDVPDGVRLSFLSENTPPGLAGDNYLAIDGDTQEKQEITPYNPNSLLQYIIGYEKYQVDTAFTPFENQWYFRGWWVQYPLGNKWIRPTTIKANDKKMYLLQVPGIITQEEPDPKTKSLIYNKENNTEYVLPETSYSIKGKTYSVDNYVKYFSAPAMLSFFQKKGVDLYKWDEAELDGGYYITEGPFRWGANTGHDKTFSIASWFGDYIYRVRIDELNSEPEFTQSLDYFFLNNRYASPEYYEAVKQDMSLLHMTSGSFFFDIVENITTNELAEKLWNVLSSMGLKALLKIYNPKTKSLWVEQYQVILKEDDKTASINFVTSFPIPFKPPLESPARSIDDYSIDTLQDFCVRLKSIYYVPF